MKTFPTLYKMSSTGALQHWIISVSEQVAPLTDGPVGVIETRYGQEGGKVQVAEDVIKIGKNIGKKNETTAYEQAEAEAQAKWEKQLKKGYVKTKEEARAGAVDEIIEGGVAPMLAHKFSEQSHKIKYPALVQPKFDGHRCIAVVKDGKATLWTRTRKPITGLPHIIRDIEKLVTPGTFTEDMVLDGELYNHDYRENFEELSSFIRTPDPKPGHEVVQYHVYDLVSGDSQAERLGDLLGGVFEDRPVRGSLVAVETRTVNSKEELDEAFAEFMEQGYEGLMVRNLAGKYVNKRSYDLQKVKEFDDAEFQVVGVEEGRGKLAGKAIFVCVTKPPVGAEFRVKMKGKLEDLAKYVKDPGLAINKMLTVRYFGFSNANNVPRFPVGIRFRED